MQDIALTAKSHLDFSGLGELKAKAQKNQQGAAEEVGRQFEAMFVQMIFKSMRQANEPLKDGLFGSNTEDSYEQMYHQELAQVMSQTGAFGLGDWLTNQVTGQTNPTKAIQAYEETPREALPLVKDDKSKPMSFSNDSNFRIKG